MTMFRLRDGIAGAAILGVSVLSSGVVFAHDHGAADATVVGDAASDGGMSHDGANVNATLPAGVSGAAMIGQGQIMVMYMPMIMNMEGNYVGQDKVSTAQLLKTPNLSSGGPAYLRILPNSMDADMHMFGITYGLSDALNIMVMGSYVDKSMDMTTWNMMGKAIVGDRTNSTDGFGDTSVVALLRLYDDGVNHVHVNFGFSLPTGSTTEEMTMLSPMGTNMVHRAMYGMQLGSGTVDLLPALVYTGARNFWSWGAAWRARLPMEENNGYHWGNLNQLTGWLGYTVYPGVTFTGRIAGTWQDKISGADPEIFGGMQGAYPGWYGGERLDLFGGIEVAGHEFGLGHTKFAIEAGAPVYQDLNGPQIGSNWQLNASFGIMF